MNYPPKRFQVDDVIREVKAAGFKAIEFAEQIQHFNRIPDFQGLMNREGMAMASLSSIVSYRKDDPMDETKRRAEHGAKFGVKALMLCGGWGPEASSKSEELFENLAENIDNLCKYIKKYNIIGAFHPHMQTIVETYEDTERLLKKMNLGEICLDIAHFSVSGSDPIEFFKKHKDKIALIHIKDWIDDETAECCGRKGRFCELGQGRLDVVGFLNIVRDAAFDGYVVIELDSTTRSPFESAKISYEFLHSRGYI
jgi:sugar phosphate isomerase/epimerase